MRTIISICCIVGLALVTFSCKTSSLLVARFDSDAIGSTPAHDLPGNPVGDRVDYIPELASGLKVRNWVTGSYKALEFSRVNTGSISGHSTWLSFKGISSNLAQTVWFVYNAKYTPDFNSEVITDLSDGSGAPIARLKLKSNGQMVLIGSDWTTETVVGTVPLNVPHTVIFVVDAGRTSFNLSIYATGQPAIIRNNQPTMTRNALDFHNPCNPSISFNFGDQSGTGTKYLIDDIVISRKEPK